MADGSEINLSKISALATGPRDEFIDFVENSELNREDLEKLKQAEESGKKREEVLRIIEEESKKNQISGHIRIAEADIKEIEDMMEKVTNIEDIEDFHESKTSINQDKLLELVGGTVQDIKEFVKDSNLNAIKIKEILEAEKKVKNRSTAKSYLERKMNQRTVAKDVKNAKEDFNKLEKDLQSLEEDGSVGTNDTAVAEEIQRMMDEENTEKEEIIDQNSDNKETSGKSEDEEKRSDSQEREDFSEENSNDSNKQENVEEANQKSGEQEDLEEENEPEDSKDQSEGSEDKEEHSKTNETDSEPEETKGEELERKKKLSEKLGLELSEEELREQNLDDLEELDDEKEHRSKLVQELIKEGFEKEKLDQVTTDDLEKIAKSSIKKKKVKKKSEDREKIIEGAENDLRSLMGVIHKDKEKADEEKFNPKETINEYKQKFADILNRKDEEDEEDTGEIDKKKIKDLLNSYRSNKREEAAVKTAQVMKTYLEQQLEVERELTYKEMSERLPKSKKEMEKLADFFNKMNREQYTGKLEVSREKEFIDTSLEVIDSL